MLGEALGTDRENVILATKFGMDMRGANGPDWGVRGSRRYIRKAVEASLRRLRTDYIDLYQLHAPDPVTPIEETLAALHELVLEGKVRNIGSSNFAGGRSSTPTGRPGPAATSASSARRTSTPCSTATSRTSWSRRASGSAWASCPSSRWSSACSPASTSGARTHRRAPDSPRRRSRLEGADWDRIEAVEAFAAAARPLDAAGGHRRPRGAAGRRLRHRRGHPRRAGRRQRRGRRCGSRPADDLAALEEATSLD